MVDPHLSPRLCLVLSSFLEAQVETGRGCGQYPILSGPARTRFPVLRFLFMIQVIFILTGFSLVLKPAGRIILRTLDRTGASAAWNRSVRAGIPIRSGEPAAWLKSPDMKLDTLVLFDGTRQNLSRFPCLSRHGSLPGQPGLKIIQAHRDIHFREMEKLRTGSVVYLDSGKGVQIYRIVETEIMSPEQATARMLEHREGDWLVLVTCYPFRFIGPAPERYLAWARSSSETI